MAHFNWSEKYSVNVRAIDEQHMELINIINKLHQAMLEKKSKLIMGEILTELLAYTQKHFEYEENLLEKYEYPSLEEHKRVHFEMSRKVEQLLDDHKTGVTIISRSVMDFLKGWLANHIMGNDHLYKDFLNSEGVY